MAVTSTSSSLSSPGIGSGLDVTGLVSKLMSVEQQPLTALQTQVTSFQTQLSAYGTIKGALSALQTAAQALNTPAKASPVKANVADSTILAATAGTGAVAGTYNVEVDSLAQAQKLTSSGFADTSTTRLGTGTITIDFGTYTGTAGSATWAANTGKTSKSVTIDNTNNTLQGMRDAINGAALGVTATIVNDGSANGNHLSITSNDTGAKNAMKISVANATGQMAQFAYDATAGGSTLTQAAGQGAADAQIKVDGMSITKSSNVITDAIQGVTLNLSKVTGSGVSTAVSLTKDTASIQSNIQAFVKAFNDVNTALVNSSSFDATNNKAATLTGDATVRTIRSQLHSLFNTPISGAPAGQSTLADIGVTFQKDGTLAVDNTKLTAALNNPSLDMGRLLGYSGTVKGYAAQMDFSLGQILSPVGTLANRTNGINTSITQIGKKEDALNVRLATIQKNYTAKFNALDTMLASMNQTSTYLTQQFASLTSSKTTG